MLLGFSVPAAAEMRTVELAYEVPLNLLRVPASNTGIVVFKECAECEEFRAPVTATTVFVLNGKPVLLKDFRKSLFKVRDRKAEIVTVRRHLKSNTVTVMKVTQ
jgi:hypothetical protein